MKWFSKYELAFPILYPREPLSHRIIVDFCLKNAFSAIKSRFNAAILERKDSFQHLQFELLRAMDAGESSGCVLETKHCADRFYNGEFDRAESLTYTSPSGNSDTVFYL